MTQTQALFAGLALGLIVGYLLACWRVSRATRSPIRAVIPGGGPKPTTPV